MKTTNILITVIGLILILGIIWLIAQNVKKTNIKNAAIASGVPAPIATSISNSSNPQKSAERVGIPTLVAASIANGIPVTVS